MDKKCWKLIRKLAGNRVKSARNRKLDGKTGRPKHKIPKNFNKSQNRLVSKFPFSKLVGWIFQTISECFISISLAMRSLTNVKIKAHRKRFFKLFISHPHSNFKLRRRVQLKVMTIYTSKLMRVSGFEKSKFGSYAFVTYSQEKHKVFSIQILDSRITKLIIGVIWWPFSIHYHKLGKKWIKGL